MAQNEGTKTPGNKMKIEIIKDGPYLVSGDVPLVRKTQVVSEHGEPLTWKKEKDLETDEEYRLCRCGQSANKPFCDDTHLLVGFDGSEQADTSARTATPASLGRLGMFQARRKIYVEKKRPALYEFRVLQPSKCKSVRFIGAR